MLIGKQITIQINECDVRADIGQLITIFAEKIKNGKYNIYLEIYKTKNIDINKFISPKKKKYGHPILLPVEPKEIESRIPKHTTYKKIIKTTKTIQKKSVFKV